jgi:anti-anti-sigma regulatory factor
MQHRHVGLVSIHNDITVVCLPQVTLEAINEHTCALGLGQSPLVAEFLDEFAYAIQAARGGVLVDMRDTRYLDHASVALMCRLAKLLAKRNLPWVICCSPEVKDILEVCLLTMIGPYATDLEAAVIRLGRDGATAGTVQSLMGQSS